MSALTCSRQLRLDLLFVNPRRAAYTILLVEEIGRAMRAELG
jgi:hypothetical protein